MLTQVNERFKMFIADFKFHSNEQKKSRRKTVSKKKHKLLKKLKLFFIFVGKYK